MSIRSFKFETIPGYPQYGISRDGIVIRYETNEIIPPTRNPRGYTAVTIHRGTRNIRTISPNVAKLLLLTYNPPKDEATDTAYLGVNYLNGNTSDIRLSNLEWDYSVYTPPWIMGINLTPYQFVRIPGFNADINSYGTVTSKGQPLVQARDNGYRSVLVQREDGKTIRYMTHRLVALTFLEHPHDTSELVTNHKNGITSDNRIDNLEWTTYSGNIYHAHKTGLRIDSKPIVVMTIETREVTKYHSLNSFATHIGLDDGTMWWRLRNHSDILPYQSYYVKYQDDLRPWPAPDTVFYRPELGVSVEVKNIRTKEVKEFDSIIKASDFVGKDPSSIAYQMSKSLPTPYLEYLIRKTSKEPWPEYTEADIPDRLCSHPIKILTRDIKTGEVVLHQSSNQAAIYVGAPGQSSVIGKYATDANTIPYKGYFIRHDRPDVQWPDFADYHSAQIITKNVKTGEDIIHTGTSQAAKYFKTTTTAVLYWARLETMPLFEGHFIRVYSKGFVWPTVYQPSRNNFVYYTTASDGTTTQYDNITRMARVVKTHVATLSLRLKQGPVVLKGYTITMTPNIQAVMSVTV